MNNRTVIAIGMIILMIGVALIILSPSLLITETIPDFIPGRGQPQHSINSDLSNSAFFFGIALLILGGITSALGFSQFISTQLTPSRMTTQPVVTQSVSPKSLRLGNTPGEVQSIMGQPDKVINFGARVTHVYKHMKIIYVDGKVSYWELLAQDEQTRT